MRESKIDIIKQNNLKINSLIQEIINSNHEEAFKNDQNGNYEITDTYKEIIELEIEKIFKLYHLEFPNLPYDKNRKLNISVYEGIHIDACCEDNSLKFSSGIKTGFEKLKTGKLDSTNIGYSIENDGRVVFEENGLTEKISTNFIDKKDGRPFIIKKDELVENDFNHMSDILYYYLNDSKYEEAIFSFIPHELVHAFGFGGEIFEGLTENLTREVSAKYGLQNKPFARQDLVKFMQKIEKIIGRDKLVEHSHIFNKKEERTNIISNLIDDKLQSKEKDLFKTLCDTFKENSIYNNNLEKELLQKFKSNELTIEQAQKIVQEDENIKKYKELEGSCFEKLEIYLQEYIDKNPKKLFSLGDTNIKAKSKDFQDVISFQECEIDSLYQILERIKEKNPKSNNNFKNSLQNMLNNHLSEKELLENNDKTPKTKLNPEKNII